MPKAQINGIELYYEMHGQGPAVVFAHGAGGNHLSWWQQVPVLARQYRCISFDHRGFGQSLDVPNGPGSQAFVQDLKSLLDDLEIERAALVAQSMGGRTCLGFTLAYPERVSALVLADTTGGFSDARMAQLRAEGEAALGGANPPPRTRVTFRRSSRPRPFSMSRFVLSIHHARRRQCLGRPPSRSVPCGLPRC